MTSLAKPSRAERLLAKLARKNAERGPKLRKQLKDRIQNYGRRGDDTALSGPEFKRAVLARDGGRCQIAGCETPRLGVTAHHARRVGAGGVSALWNGLSLCAVHHERTENGQLDKHTVLTIILDRYGYPETQAELERTDARDAMRSAA